MVLGGFFVLLQKMIKRILIINTFVVVALLVALSMTKPDRMAHYDAVKNMALKTVDHELTSNPLTAEYATIGTMAALNVIDEYLQRNFIVREHTFYTSGILVYNDMFIPVSIGIMGKVYLTVNEDDLKRMLDRPEIQQMIDIKNILK